MAVISQAINFFQEPGVELISVGSGLMDNARQIWAERRGYSIWGVLAIAQGA